MIPDGEQLPICDRATPFLAPRKRQQSLQHCRETAVWVIRYWSPYVAVWEDRLVRVERHSCAYHVGAMVNAIGPECRDIKLERIR